MTRRERIDMMGDRAKKFTNVYVKNFGDSLDDDKMRQVFETCGPITSCKVQRSFRYTCLLLGIVQSYDVFQFSWLSKRRLNWGSFVLLYFALCAFQSCI